MVVFESLYFFFVNEKWYIGERLQVNFFNKSLLEYQKLG